MSTYRRVAVSPWSRITGTPVPVRSPARVTPVGVSREKACVALLISRYGLYRRNPAVTHENRPDGAPRHLAQDARLLRPRRGGRLPDRRATAARARRGARGPVPRAAERAPAGEPPAAPRRVRRHL